MDQSFNGAREVLKKLAEHSPQAEHYAEILTAFADAIQRHRQHLSRETRPNQYVRRILSLDFSPGDSVSQPSSSIPMTSMTHVDQHTDFQNERTGDFTPALLPTSSALPHIDDGGGFDLGLFGWDSFAMQLTENFAYDNYDSTWGLGG